MKRRILSLLLALCMVLSLLPPTTLAAEGETPSEVVLEMYAGTPSTTDETVYDHILWTATPGDEVKDVFYATTDKDTGRVTDITPTYIDDETTPWNIRLDNTKTVAELTLKDAYIYAQTKSSAYTFGTKAQPTALTVSGGGALKVTVTGEKDSKIQAGYSACASFNMTGKTTITSTNGQQLYFNYNGSSALKPFTSAGAGGLLLDNANIKADNAAENRWPNNCPTFAVTKGDLTIRDGKLEVIAGGKTSQGIYVSEGNLILEGEAVVTVTKTSYNRADNMAANIHAVYAQKGIEFGGRKLLITDSADKTGWTTSYGNLGTVYHKTINTKPTFPASIAEGNDKVVVKVGNSVNEAEATEIPKEDLQEATISTYSYLSFERVCVEHKYDNDQDITCNKCGEKRACIEHVYDDKYTDAICNNCDEERELPKDITVTLAGATWNAAPGQIYYATTTSNAFVDAGVLRGDDTVAAVPEGFTERTEEPTEWNIKLDNTKAVAELTLKDINITVPSANGDAINVSGGGALKIIVDGTINADGTTTDSTVKTDYGNLLQLTMTGGTTITSVNNTKLTLWANGSGGWAALRAYGSELVLDNANIHTYIKMGNNGNYGYSVYGEKNITVKGGTLYVDAANVMSNGIYITGQTSKLIIQDAADVTVNKTATGHSSATTTIYAVYAQGGIDVDGGKLTITDSANVDIGVSGKSYIINTNPDITSLVAAGDSVVVMGNKKDEAVAELTLPLADISEYRYLSFQYVCGEHAYDSNYDLVCNKCGEKRDCTGHTGGIATCTQLAVCDICGEAYGELKDHEYDNEYDGICNVCGEETRDVAEDVTIKLVTTDVDITKFDETTAAKYIHEVIVKPGEVLYVVADDTTGCVTSFAIAETAPEGWDFMLDNTKVVAELVFDNNAYLKKSGDTKNADNTYNNLLTVTGAGALKVIARSDAKLESYYANVFETNMGEGTTYTTENGSLLTVWQAGTSSAVAILETTGDLTFDHANVRAINAHYANGWANYVIQAKKNMNVIGGRLEVLAQDGNAFTACAIWGIGVTGKLTLSDYAWVTVEQNAKGTDIFGVGVYTTEQNAGLDTPEEWQVYEPRGAVHATGGIDINNATLYIKDNAEDMFEYVLNVMPNVTGATVWHKDSIDGDAIQGLGDSNYTNSRRKVTAGYEYPYVAIIANCEHKGGTATCAKLAVCEICGNTYGDLLPHSFTDKNSGELASAADCENAAAYYVQCDNCDAVSDTETVAVGEPNGHKYDDDCTTNDKCENCDVYAGANDAHAFDDDCLTADQCENCAQVAEAKDHVFDNDCTTADRCANCAQTATAAETHAPVADDGDCTTAVKCANCDKNAVEAKSHDFDDDPTTDDECKNEGCEVTHGIQHTHDYTKVEYDADGHWTECGCGDETEKVAHDYEEDVHAPDCVTGGYTIFSCDCGYSYQGAEVDPNGHNYDNGYCTICGAEDPNGAFVAVNGDKKYVDLMTALNEAQNGDFVTLVADATVTGYAELKHGVTYTIPEGKTLTVAGGASVFAQSTAHLNCYGKIVVEGQGVNQAVANISNLVYGDTFGACGGKLTVKADGVVYMPAAWEGIWTPVNDAQLGAMLEDCQPGSRIYVGTQEWGMNILGWYHINHVGPEATCTAPSICTVCGAELAPATGHNEGEVKIENKKDATLNAPGSYEEVVYCSVCGVELRRVEKTIDQLTGAVAEIDGYYYDSLQAAFDAAKDGDIIELLTSVKLAGYVKVTTAGNITLDMKGNSITREDGTGIYVNNAATVLTITGNGKIDAYQAVYANAGKVIIENGTYHGVADTIYVQNTGKVEINGGTFSVEKTTHTQDEYCVLNQLDADRATTSIVVKGGTFVGFNPENNASEGANTDFTADGYIAIDNGDGTYTVRQGKWVAQVGNDKFESLQAAIDAANGKTVKLLTDITVESDLNNAAKGLYNIADGMNVTIDLNGKTIDVTDNSTGNFYVFYNYGELTIKNGTINLTATIDREWNAQSTIILNRGGILTVESGTYKHLGGTDMAITMDNSANSFGDAYMYVVGGTIRSEKYIAIRMRMEDPNGNGNPGNGISNLEVSGGYIYGLNRGIWGQKSTSANELMGTLTITGGTVENATADRGAVQFDSDTYEAQNVAATISGNAVIKGLVIAGDDEMIISGGTFSSAVPEEFCAEGYIPVDNGDGTYGVKVGKFVAQVGDKKFETLADAIAAVADGGEITLLDNITVEHSTVILPANVTLNGNNKILTVNGEVTRGGTEFAILLTGNATIKDLTIEGGSRGIYADIDKSFDVTLDNVTILKSARAISTNGMAYDAYGTGTLTVKNSTLAGWISWCGRNFKEAKFENVDFVIGNGPRGNGLDIYTTTTLIGCDFADGFVLDVSSLLPNAVVTKDATTVDAPEGYCWNNSGVLGAHVADEGAVTTDPTCTTEGEKTFKCVHCGEVMGTATVPVAPHNTNGTVEHVDATCTTTGVVGGTYCTACGEGKAAAEEIIPVAPHNTNGTVDHVDATCTTTGVVGGKYCTVCGEGKAAAEAVIPVTDHTFVENPEDKYLKTPATINSKAVYYKSCAVCGVASEDFFEYGEISDNYVASIGGTNYATLADALDKAVEGDVIVLHKNSVGAGFEITEDITINFGGFYYSVTENAEGTAAVKISANVTFTGNGGGLYLNNGNKDNADTLILNAGTLTTTGEVVLCGQYLHEGEESWVVKNTENAEATFNAGTEILTSWKGIGNAINGEGTFKAEIVINAPAGYCWNEGVLNAHTFIEKVDAKYLKTPATINSKAVYYKSCAVCGVASEDFFEYGDILDNYVASIGNKNYATLADALKEAVEGNEIVLHKNSVGAGFEITEDITINFGGFYYSVTENADGTAAVMISANVTFTGNGGGLYLNNGNKDNADTLILNAGTLTTTGEVVLSGQYLHEGEESWVVKNTENAEATFNAGTEILTSWKGIGNAINVGKFTNYSDDVKAPDGYHWSAGALEEHAHNTIVVVGATETEKGYTKHMCSCEDYTVTDYFSKDIARVKLNDGTYFMTLADALDAAESGDTITLLKNIVGAGFEITEDITINFGGFYYSVTENAEGTAAVKISANVTFTGNGGGLYLNNGNKDNADTLILNEGKLTTTGEVVLCGQYLHEGEESWVVYNVGDAVANIDSATILTSWKGIGNKTN